MLPVFLHMWLHHSPLWHVSTGPSGWWAWTQQAYEAVGFGWNHAEGFVSAFEVR